MIGRTLGRYRILEKLGEGGMGQVWKAADAHLPRSVALKLLRESLLTSPDARRRFLREATAACKLDHPAIASVFDADQVDGDVLIAYQFVDGKTIAERLASGPMPIAEAVALTRQAAEGLAHAHAHGVLHRDISSRNLMVTPDGRLKIVDFGLAQVEELSRVTSSNTLVGTAGYIAPEVIRNRQWSERSDVYALGTVLYEMLTGRVPFEGPFEAQVYDKMHRDAEPPSDHREIMPGALDDLVLRALERDPEDRIPSAEVLIGELAQLETSGTLPAAPDPTTPSERRGSVPVPRSGSILRRLRRTWRTVSARRNRAMAVTLLASILIIAALATNVVQRVQRWLSPANERIQSVAVLPLLNESEYPEDSEYRAAGLCKAVVDKLSPLSDLRVLPWLTTQQFLGTDEPLAEIAKTLGVDALVTGTFREDDLRTDVTLSIVDGSGFQVWGQPFEARPDDFIRLVSDVSLGVANALTKSMTADEQRALEKPVAKSQDAYDLYMQGVHYFGFGDRETTDDAMVYFDRAVEVDPEYANAHVAIGAVYSRRYFQGWAGGFASLHEAESHFLQALRSDPESFAARRGLIRIYLEKGENEKSLQIGAQIVPRSERDVEALEARGLAYMMGGMPSRGAPLFKRAIDLDPANEAAHWWLVSCQGWAGIHRENVAVGHSFFRRFHEDPEIYFWVGLSYHALGVLDSAKTHYLQALRLFEDHSNLYVFLFAGVCFNELGDRDSAYVLWNSGKREIEERLTADPDNTRMRSILAAMYAQLGQRELFFATTERLVQDQTILAIPGFGRAYLASGFARLEDIDGAAKIIQSSPDNDHFEEVFLDPQWWRAFGAPGLLDHPGFAEGRKWLTDRYDRLKAKY